MGLVTRKTVHLSGRRPLELHNYIDQGQITALTAEAGPVWSYRCVGEERASCREKREIFLEIYVSGTHLKPLPAIKVLILLCTLHPILLVQPPPRWAGWRSLVGKRHSICRPPHSGQIVKWWLSTSKVSGSERWHRHWAESRTESSWRRNREGE